MSTSAEKRANKRRRKYATIIYSEKSSNNYKDAIMHNSSHEGMCFTSDFPLKPGSNISVKIADALIDDLGPEAKDGMLAEVKWCNKMGDTDVSFYGVGIEYHEPLKYQL